MGIRPEVQAEFKRVLKPDGFVVITSPDLQSVCALVADDKLLDPAYTSPAGPITPLDILYGHRPPMARGNPDCHCEPFAKLRTGCSVVIHAGGPTPWLVMRER